MERLAPGGRPALAFAVIVIAVAVFIAAGLFMASHNTEAGMFRPSNPVIGPSGAVVTYPSDYSQLAAHVLSLINQARAEQGVPPVALSAEPSGQQHADSMLYNGYFSHWDVQGYKPYMRYTLLNGTGAVVENAAWSHSPTPLFPGTAAAEGGLDDLHYRMMYDDAFENWGHRTNILDPTHDAVSIGVAYNATDLYLVEDFENSYSNLTISYSQSSGNVTLQGALDPYVNPDAIQVYYDPQPQALAAFQLMTVSNFTGAYDPGMAAGSVFPPCGIVCPASTGKVEVIASGQTRGARTPEGVSELHGVAHLDPDRAHVPVE
jgi:uncharacterized protein YkwD